MAGAASIPTQSLSPPTWGQAPQLLLALVPPCLTLAGSAVLSFGSLRLGLDLEKLADRVVTLSGGTGAATAFCTASPCLPSPRSAGWFLGCGDPIMWDLKVPGFTAKMMFSVCLGTPKPQLAFRGPTQVVY